AEESHGTRHANLALLGRADRLRKERRVIQTSVGVTNLPLAVVVVVIRSPNGKRRFLSWRNLVKNPHHPPERLDALEVVNVPVAHRQQHIPFRSVRVEDSAGLTVHWTNFKNTLERDRVGNHRRPRAAWIAVEVVGGSCAFATARVT